jgi:hypothetical protein
VLVKIGWSTYASNDALPWRKEGWNAPGTSV